MQENPNPLELITFDTSGFKSQGDINGTRVWYSPENDGVGLYYYGIPPDINCDIAKVQVVRDFYRQFASNAGLAIIEVETLMIGGCHAIRTIIKAPQRPTGMTYLGSITLPFRDFSFVLKVQCAEQGATGFREAVVLDQLISSGEVTVSSDGKIQGWMKDPYDSSIEAPLMRNQSEACEYDNQFPDHPLSRARNVLNHIEKTLAIAPEVLSSASFEGQALANKSKPWWKRW